MKDLQELLQKCKASIDVVFGEGYARANPLLVDRLLQREFKTQRGALQKTKTHRISTHLESIVEDVIESDSVPVSVACDGTEMYANRDVSIAVANAMGVKLNRALEANIGKALSRIVGESSQRTVFKSGSVSLRLRGYEVSKFKEN